MKWTTWLVSLPCILLSHSCSEEALPEPRFSSQPILTEKLETENFVFHYAEGDAVQAERMEAFHEWAVKYLGIVPPKKIDFYKYRNRDEIESVYGIRANFAIPSEFAVVSSYPFHPHECFHLYNSLISSTNRFLDEGMVVAHEIDPLNNIWRPYRDRGIVSELSEPYAYIVREYYQNDQFFPIQQLLNSDGFNNCASQNSRIAYRQVGMFIHYLIGKYGLKKMKSLMKKVEYEETNQRINNKFSKIYHISIYTAYDNWIKTLSSMPKIEFPLRHSSLQ